MITPVDPEQAMKATSSAAEHGEVIMRIFPPLAVALIVGSLFIVHDVLQVKTWRGRLVVYVSKMTSGLGAGYLMLLVLPMLPHKPSVEMQQLAALVGFYLGKDSVEAVARRFFGFKTRSDDDLLKF